MTAPVFKVEIGIPPTSTSEPLAFVLNHATRGKLNSATYKLAADTHWVDVTGSAYEIDTWRGRNRELDRTDTGTCTIGVWNNRVDLGTARHFDPDNTASPLYPYLQPWRAKIRVTIDTVVVYTGWLNDWTVSEPKDGVSFVQFSAVDAFARMARDIEFTGRLVQTGKERLNALLDLAYFYGPRSVATGAINFQAGIVQSGSLLDRIFEVVQAELGIAFIAPNETFVFLAKATIDASSSVLTLSDSPAAAVRYSSFERQSGAELLYNSVTVTRSGDPDAVPQSVSNKANEALFGLRPLSYEFPVATDGDALAIATLLLGRYQNPITRFKTVTIPTARYASSVRMQILALELGQTVTMVRTPVGTGTPTTLTQVCTIIGVSHRGEPRRLETVLTLQTKV